MLIRFWHSQVRKRTIYCVCLILDNGSAHGEALPTFPGVESIFFSPNVTSAYQPLDQGDLRKVKSVARNELLLRIMATTITRMEIFYQNCNRAHENWLEELLSLVDAICASKSAMPLETAL